MNSDYWINKWQAGETRFHQSQYHSLLVKYANRLKQGTILVPLCGKTLDMLFLLQQGHSVIGVELSPIACKDFFEENNIEYKKRDSNGFTIYESEKITLWCGDFFKLPSDVWNAVTGIYDRAALIALPLDVRQKYAAEINARSKSGCEVLLITLEYHQDAFKGPPFSVTEEEIASIYKSFTLEKLQAEKELKITKDNPNFKEIELLETIYWLQKN